MNVVFLGATRGIGRHLARMMSERGDRLCLLGRTPADLAKTAQDLALRSTSRAEPATVACDLEDAASIAPALDAAWRALGKVDVVVLSAAVYAAQEDLEKDAEATRRLIEIDFTNTIRFCEDARHRLLARGGGTLCVFSSVAGDRGRRAVAIYGAAKAGLSHYLESLDHGYRKDGLVTICVKPGFVHTGMTAGAKPPPFASEPEPVARRVLAAIDAKKPLVYAPAIWWAVMRVIRSLPRFVMRRTKF